MSRLTEAANELEPLQQGACDYLCGVYSIINAIRLARYPETINAHQLFEDAIQYLIAKERLAEVMQHGMGTGLSRRMLNSLLSSHYSSLKLKAIPSFPVFPAKTSFENAFSKDQPVLFELSGHCYHYTVATQVKGNRLILFDSDGMRWIKLSSLQLSPEVESRSRYEIVQKSTVAISRD